MAIFTGDTWHKRFLSDTQHNNTAIMLNGFVLSVALFHCYAGYHGALG